MNENWAIIISALILVGSIFFATQWDQYLVAGIAIAALLVIAIIFFLRKKIKEASSNDIMPDTKYTYEPKK
jgi:hypothetical protein